MNYFYIDIEPMECSISDGLNFDDEPTAIEPPEPTYDEIRQQNVDDLDDVLADIGGVYNPGFMTRNQA